LNEAAGRAGRGTPRAQRGQALVELAITTVVLLVLLAGLLDVSRAFHYTIGLEGAVRAGARHGVFYNTPTNQQPYLDDADIKAAVDQVLAGDGLSASTLVTSASCLTPTDSNTWVNPPYAASAYPTAVNSPKLYICYDTQGSNKSGTKATPPAVGNSTYTGTDLVVIVLDRFGLIGGLSSEYLKQGSGVSSITLTAFQHFSVQG
jgi:Flp pilus assembly protein TadG